MSNNGSKPGNSGSGSGFKYVPGKKYDRAQLEKSGQWGDYLKAKKAWAIKAHGAAVKEGEEIKAREEIFENVKSAATFIPIFGEAVQLADNLAKLKHGEKVTALDWAGCIPILGKGGKVAKGLGVAADALKATGKLAKIEKAGVKIAKITEKAGTAILGKTGRVGQFVAKRKGVLFDAGLMGTGFVASGEEDSPAAASKTVAGKYGSNPNGSKKTTVYDRRNQTDVSGGAKARYGLHHQQLGTGNPETYDRLKARGAVQNVTYTDDQETRINTGPDGKISLSVPAKLNEKWKSYHDQVMGKMADLVENTGMKAQEALAAARTLVQTPGSSGMI